MNLEIEQNKLALKRVIHSKSLTPDKKWVASKLLSLQ